MLTPEARCALTDHISWPGVGPCARGLQTRKMTCAFPQRMSPAYYATSAMGTPEDSSVRRTQRCCLHKYWLTRPRGGERTPAYLAMPLGAPLPGTDDTDDLHA